jgi:hypothetical protein
MVLSEHRDQVRLLAKRLKHSVIKWCIQQAIKWLIKFHEGGILLLSIPSETRSYHQPSASSIQHGLSLRVVELFYFWGHMHETNLFPESGIFGNSGLSGKRAASNWYV